MTDMPVKPMTSYDLYQFEGGVEEIMEAVNEVRFQHFGYAQRAQDPMTLNELKAVVTQWGARNGWSAEPEQLEELRALTVITVVSDAGPLQQAAEVELKKFLTAIEEQA